MPSSSLAETAGAVDSLPSAAKERPQLSVISPTYNEVDNVERLVGELSRALQGVRYEILIVDDNSPDRTWKRAEELARVDPRVRVLRRMQDPGLGKSVIDGFSAALGDAVACIDSDLQHDPQALPEMLRQLEQGADLVYGCRYMPGGGTSDWGWLRRFESQLATRFTQWVLRVKLRDPMSGYFIMHRQDFLRIKESLHGEGFKILLEIVANLKPRTIREVPYTFRARTAGQSKLTGKVVLAFLRQLWRLSGRGHA
jgi:dolichol-phosphate mannosyltransferase